MNPYYEQDGITIYLGKAESYLPELQFKSAVVVTDPPFLQDGGVSIVGRGVSHRVEDSETLGTPWGYSLDWIGYANSLIPRHWVVFCNYRMLGDLQNKIERYATLGCIFVWKKSNAPQMARPVPRFDCEFIMWARHRDSSCGRMGEFKSMVLDVPLPQAGCMASERITINGGKAAHPCQKPIAVVQPFVDRLGVRGDVIVDPFCGTGTTLVAAKNAGLRAVGIEQNEAYCEIAAKRLAQGVLFGAA